MRKQCVIKWSWDSQHLTPEGLKPISLELFITKFIIPQGYIITSTVVTEYDESGHILHALIIATPPETGGILH